MTLWYRSHGTSIVKEITNKVNRLTIDVGEVALSTQDTGQAVICVMQRACMDS